MSLKQMLVGCLLAGYVEGMTPGGTLHDGPRELGVVPLSEARQCIRMTLKLKPVQPKPAEKMQKDV